MKLLRSLYDWMMAWGQSPRGGLALFAIALFEPTFFPIPPDVLLLALGLSLPAKAYRFAAYATLGSVLGGCLGYLVGYGFWEAVQPFFFQYVPGVSADGFVTIQQWFERYDFWVVFTAGFTPLPYRIITISSGVFHIDFWLFVFASLVSRGLRFFLIAGLLHRYGAPIKQWIEKYFNLLSVLVTLVIIVVFIVYQFFHR